MALSKNDVRQLTILCRSMWNEFDPIGVTDAGIDDEYDSYVAQSVKLIVEGADRHRFRQQIENGIRAMGMAGFPAEKIDGFSARLAEVSQHYPVAPSDRKSSG